MIFLRIAAFTSKMLYTMIFEIIISFFVYFVNNDNKSLLLQRIHYLQRPRSDHTNGEKFTPTSNIHHHDNAITGYCRSLSIIKDCLHPLAFEHFIWYMKQSISGHLRRTETPCLKRSINPPVCRPCGKAIPILLTNYEQIGILIKV